MKKPNGEYRVSMSIEGDEYMRHGKEYSP